MYRPGEEYLRFGDVSGAPGAPPARGLSSRPHGRGHVANRLPDLAGQKRGVAAGIPSRGGQEAMELNGAQQEGLERKAGPGRRQCMWCQEKARELGFKRRAKSRQEYG